MRRRVYSRHRVRRALQFMTPNFVNRAVEIIRIMANFCKFEWQVAYVYRDSSKASR